MRSFRNIYRSDFSRLDFKRERKDGRKIFSLFIFNLIFPDMIFQHILHTNFDLASRVIVIFIITNFCVKVKFEKFYVSCWLGDTEENTASERLSTNLERKHEVWRRDKNKRRLRVNLLFLFNDILYVLSGQISDKLPDHH